MLLKNKSVAEQSADFNYSISLNIPNETKYSKNSE